MFPALLICAFMVKNAATQTVSTSLGITKSCVLIGDDVKLLCTVLSGCCASQSRVWRKGSGTSLLTNSASTDPSKYVEDYDGGNTGYNLIIKNVQKSDLGINYKCVYGLQDSELYLDDILCNCWECAGKDYGWSILGDVIGTVIILIIVIVKICKPKTVLIVGGLTFIISAVVNLFALLIGYYKCHCVDGTDPWFILLGLGTSGITGVIALTCVLNCGCCKDLRPLYDDEWLCSKCTGCCDDLIPLCDDECTEVPSVQISLPNYKVNIGSSITLRCTVVANPAHHRVYWTKTSGGQTKNIEVVNSGEKYSGSTVKSPSLTITNAAISDVATYVCYATNSIGTGHSTSTSLDVVGRKKSKQDGDQELNEKDEKDEKSQPLAK